MQRRMASVAISRALEREGRGRPVCSGKSALRVSGEYPVPMLMAPMWATMSAWIIRLSVGFPITFGELVNINARRAEQVVAGAQARGEIATDARSNVSNVTCLVAFRRHPSLL